VNLWWNLILQKHPDDLNALFYGGLCYYFLNDNLKALNNLNFVLKSNQTTFYEEAKWYKSLAYDKIGDNKKAKKIWKEIVAENGFYKEQAREKLKNK